MISPEEHTKCLGAFYFYHFRAKRINYYRGNKDTKGNMSVKFLKSREDAHIVCRSES